MLAQSPAQRPPASSFVSAQYFTEDVLLRALRFLDTMSSKEQVQKAAFLNDLNNFYSRFDTRVLKFKVRGVGGRLCLSGWKGL